MITKKSYANAAALTARFQREESGIAAVEFAFIAPLLAVFLLGTTTATQGLWAHGKVSQTSSVIGDLIAQENEIDDTIFKSIMDAGPILMEPFPINDLKVEVTAAIACYDDPSKTEGKRPEIFVAWSNGWKDGALVDGKQKPGDALTDAPKQLSIEDSDYLIRTVVTYTHEPTITSKAGHDVEMEEFAYHQPRDNKPITYEQKEGKDPVDCDDLMNR